MHPLSTTTDKTNNTTWLKLLIGWAVVLGIRLLPVRPPNMEPLLATAMPFSKRFSPATSFFFAFFGIVFYDLVTGTAGTWTLITAPTYGLITLGAWFYFRNRSGTVHYVAYGIVGTIVYDALTGLTIGPLFFGQSFVLAFIGQIPFTLSHLLGTVTLSLTLSPLLERWVVNNERLTITLPFHTTSSIHTP